MPSTESYQKLSKRDCRTVSDQALDSLHWQLENTACRLSNSQGEKSISNLEPTDDFYQSSVSVEPVRMGGDGRELKNQDVA